MNSGGEFSRKHFDQVKCQFGFALNSIFKLKIEKDKSEAQKYLESIRGSEVSDNDCNLNSRLGKRSSKKK